MNVNEENKVDSNISKRGRWSEETLGFWIVICSALCYTISLGSLRALTNYSVSYDWSLAVKELTTVCCITPFIIIQFFRHKYQFPSWRSFFLLVVAGVVCVLVGARPHLLAYASIGVALTTPILQALQLIFLALVGAVCLGERLTKSKIVAVFLCVFSVSLLSGGADSETQIAGRSMHIVLGTLCAASGAAGYAIELAILRKLLRRQPSTTSECEQTRTPTTLAMVTVTGCGALLCGITLTASRGWSGWIPPDSKCWIFVLISGFANMGGFFCQLEGLRRLYALKSTLIATAQTATLCLLGVCLFSEPFNWITGIGIVLALMGVIVSSFSK